MANPIKYNTGSESRALNKGNWWIGTRDVGKGPTSATGFWNGYDVPADGYVVYLNKATGGPSIYAPANDAELISLTNQIDNTSYTTANECLLYFAGQSDKMVLNRDYEGIVTDGLVLNVDAGFTPSYPKNGNTWYDLSGNGNNGTLTNGPTFNSANGGSIVFDGVDDRVIVGSTNAVYGNEQTWDFWVNRISSTNGNNMFGGRFLPYFAFRLDNSILFSNRINGSQRNVFTTNNNFTNNTWYNFTFSTEYNGTSTIMKIYVNGVFNNSGTYTGAQSNIDAYRFTIGDGRNTATWYPFNGSVPIVKVYNKVLTSSEILQNYNAQKGRFGL